MSRHYFDFKQMRIEQDLCAMKVSTDACIQGAWTPVAPHVKNVLDIGTGTGLLSLMLAQKSATIHIDAIEIDPQAAKQAGANVAASPFADRIRVSAADAHDLLALHRYELIICNPPFFSGSLKGRDEQRNRARHNDQLSQQALAAIIAGQLSDEGEASVLLPVSEYASWQQHANEHHLSCSKRLIIKPFEQFAPNRLVLLYSKRTPATEEETTLVIYESPGQYTGAFIELMRPYYLHL